MSIIIFYSIYNVVYNMSIIIFHSILYNVVYNMSIIVLYSIYDIVYNVYNNIL